MKLYTISIAVIGRFKACFPGGKWVWSYVWVLFFYFRAWYHANNTGPFTSIAQDFCAKFCRSHLFARIHVPWRSFSNFQYFSCAAVWNDQNGAYQTHFIWFDIVYCSYGLNYSWLYSKTPLITKLRYYIQMWMISTQHRAVILLVSQQKIWIINLRTSLYW